MPADKLKILVVDDYETARHYFCGLLDDLGYEPRSVAGTAAALSLVRQEHFDMVLSDLVMPGMGGPGLLKLLRGQGLDLPFLLITSYGSLSTAVEALRSGAHRERTQRHNLEGALATAGSAAHEMNQPLITIMASAELMQMTEDPQRLRELAKVVVEQANRLDQVTQRLVKVVPFQTKSYVDDRVTLDLEASSESGEKS